MSSSQARIVFTARRKMSTHAPFTPPFPVPKGYKPHTERTTTILLQDDNTAFLNPVQEFNRDLSVAVIRGWNQKRKESMFARWEENRTYREAKEKRKAAKLAASRAATADETNATEGSDAPAASSSTKFTPSSFNYQGITILEALSATGLRSIRYAKEIQDVKLILANDLSPTACDAMRRNVDYNNVPYIEAGSTQATEMEPERKDRREGCNGKVKVNEGDAIELMFSRRHPSKRVEVVDLDPYGTAAPFIDSAIGAVADGGLMCVTCTDLAVLAGHNWPEKCYANYGGVSANAEYSHEVALRLVLQTLSASAARYGRYIKPLISLSIDFYVRIFITVHSAPIEVKKVASHNGIVYICSYCNSFHSQPFGRVMDKPNKTEGKPDVTVYRTAPGPPVGGGSDCAECGQTLHLAGPMWLGALHDPEFVQGVLDDVRKEREAYGTWKRIEGMLFTARDEVDTMFYFTANKMTSCFHAENMSLENLVSALLNGGYKVSRSHTISGSIKSDAPRAFVNDIIRNWIETRPVRMDKIAEKSPARVMVNKPKTWTVDFTIHADAAAVIGKAKGRGEEKLVRYQANPLPNWGPAARAKTSMKRKNEDGDEAEGAETTDDNEARPAGEAKKLKVDGGVDEEALMNL